MIEVDALLADSEELAIQEPDFSAKDEWEEMEVWEILATWKQSRDMINKTKLSRGHPPTQRKFDLDKIRKKTRCFHCKRLGHFRVVRLL